MNTPRPACAGEAHRSSVAPWDELGRLSSGRAAELAGMARAEFLLSLRRYRVFALDAELEELEQRHG